MKKVVVAIDSFKGSLSSLAAAEAVEEGILSVFPYCQVIKVPIADGGEGTMAAMVEATNGRVVTVDTYDPLLRPIKANYGILGDGRTVVIELAAASGLTLLSDNERNPMKTSTFGTGVLIAHALEQGFRHFVLGIGGSATNDGGVGLLSALGFRFLDAEGSEISPVGEQLVRIRKIDIEYVVAGVYESLFNVACDVNNPLYGEDGAAYVYAKQKGASEEMIQRLDDGLKHYAAILANDFQMDISHVPGGGAAGGVGGGLTAFLKASLLPGVELILETLHFDDILSGSDLVITGEGCIDRQTVMGKAPAGVAKAANKQNIPVIAIAGSIEDGTEKQVDSVFGACFSILPRILTLEEAMRSQIARKNITQLITQICRTIQLSQSIEKLS